VRGCFSAEAVGKGIGLKLSEGNDDSPTVRKGGAVKQGWMPTEASVNSLAGNGKFPRALGYQYSVPVKLVSGS